VNQPRGVPLQPRLFEQVLHTRLQFEALHEPCDQHARLRVALDESGPFLRSLRFFVLARAEQTVLQPVQISLAEGLRTDPPGDDGYQPNSDCDPQKHR
jgi:hypothetical protein